MSVWILGAGGHGRDIDELLRACGVIAEWLDDDPAKGYPPIDGLPPGQIVVIGVNNPAVKRQIDERTNGAAIIPLHHPSASVVNFADRDLGSLVGANSSIGPGCRLGRHVHVGAGCTLTRVTVGDYSTIAPGVDIAGDVTIGEECLIGVGAVVSNLVTIGDRCVIGAGAVVVDDVPDDTTVAGVPAKPLQRKEVDKVNDPNKVYVTGDGEVVR